MTSETVLAPPPTANSTSIPNNNNNNNNNTNNSHPLKEFSAIPSVRRLEPLEVGWQFVQEYYTILNKDPNRLHCFYSKNSVMVHGVEGETVKSCQGQQEIHKRIKELDLQDGKVVISNVDSFASLANGIIGISPLNTSTCVSMLITVVVLGEMETRGNPSRKFSQSFVLAEQPNGFYVLNDIFRYLKDNFEDEVIPHHHQQDDSAVVSDEPSASTAPVSLAKAEVTVEDHVTPDHVTTVQEESVVVVKVNSDIPAVEKEVPAVANAPSVTPIVPQEPKTWAKLAETDKERWAKHVSEAKGQTVAPVTTKPQKKSSDHQQKDNSQQNHQQQQRQQQQPHKQKQEVGEQSVFIRGFSKATKIPHIKESFGQFVGTVKWVDLMTESTAYVEFNDADCVKKALDMKTLVINGENVSIDDKRANPGQTRKPRKNQPAKNGQQQQQAQKSKEKSPHQQLQGNKK